MTAAGVDAANITTPLSGEQDTGWVNGQVVVSSGKMNWLFNLLEKWILYVADAVFVAATGSALPGGSFTPDGGTAAPVRGSVNLAPLAADPTTPSNGDLWTKATGLFARVAGVTWALAALAVAQTWTALQTFSGGIAMGTAKITGLGDPTAGQDAATKTYVDVRGAKAWAFLQVGAAGAVTVTKSFNIASASYSGSSLTINLTSAVADVNCAILATPIGNAFFVSSTGMLSASQLSLNKSSAAAAAANWASGDSVCVVLFD